VSLTKNPRDEVSIGTAAKVATFAHQFFPGMVESMITRQTRKAAACHANNGSSDNRDEDA
jgi:hypothetical protein